MLKSFQSQNITYKHYLTPHASDISGFVLINHLLLEISNAVELEMVDGLRTLRKYYSSFVICKLLSTNKV